MTENKRFMLDDAGELIDLNNHKFIDYDEECCNLLNELAEENEEFRKRTKELIAVSLDYPTINLDLIAEAIKSLRELIE